MPPVHSQGFMERAMLRRKVAAMSALLVAGSVLFTAQDAEAIPAFSRKYQTSCTTCHVAYPKLNAFGEAFRLNGYRYPGEIPAHVKEEPTSLGAPGWKRVWPDGVWPASIPGTAPVALRTKFRYRYASEIAESGEREFVRGDFEFPSEVGLLAGGTIGDDMSFFTALEVGREVEDGGIHTEMDIHRAQLNWNDLFGRPNAVNLKIGYFEPELVTGISSHRKLTFADYDPIFSFEPIDHEGGEGYAGGHGSAGARGVALPRTSTGLELYGILRSRFLYAAGVAAGQGPGEKSFDGNASKDLYGRVSYKFGGMALDGTTASGTAGEPPQGDNWVDDSLRLGLFGYAGSGKGIRFDLAAAGEPPQVFEDVTYRRFGIDASWYIGSLNVFGAYISGSDELREGGDPSTDEIFDYSALSIEADYVVKPWIVAVLRYDQLNPASAMAGTLRRLVPNVTFLLRANVKAVLELQQDIEENRNYTFLAGLDVAF